jgi:hypothetical protein
MRQTAAAAAEERFPIGVQLMRRPTWLSCTGVDFLGKAQQQPCMAQSAAVPAA